MKYLPLLIAASSFISISVFAGTQSIYVTQIQKKLVNLEKSFDGKIGVYAIDTNSNHVIAYRESERFPVQSTFKLIGVADILKNSMATPNLLQKKVAYTKQDLVTWWSPVTQQHLAKGMTIYQLSEAAMSYSDNTAINLLMKRLGGPESVTAFANAIGNKSFNVVHYEANLNSNPKVKQDTSTPKDMAISLQKLTLGRILAQPQRTQLVTWMRNNTTGYKRILAGVPVGWAVADKTGSGSYGVANDIGIMWSPACKPIVLAIYTVRNNQKAKSRDDILASTTRIILNAFAKNDRCFELS